jgi:hypothetical protein
MNKCPYCGLEPRDDYRAEFRCGSYGYGHRSRACLVLEIGLLKERVTDRERERDHANLVADSALRENKSLVERVKRLEEAGDRLADWHLAVVTTREKAERDVARWNEAKEAKP